MEKFSMEWSNEELRTTFDLFDTNKDGKISKDELSQERFFISSSCFVAKLTPKTSSSSLLND